ncbi:hypothetical protein [Microcoleus sp. FACHB-672]|uniref:hypothetical protein n=1 Tax=Microcoleus sp. FACHB-672 TaxID=2692825 RepID=UPI001684231F|nr:hypothetical protein [Microcoleus sp. FACHB-672]MBD2040989.1 hypothetical protein [Microcoleus sp. FACHB-672]
MDDEFSSWLCHVKLLVCNPDKNSCQSDLVYCSFPAKAYDHLLGFQNEKLKIIAIFNFHPMNHCAIAEIDEPEQIKASIKVLRVEDDLSNFRICAKWFIRRFNLVAYYGFDVETVMQIAANKQVDIILVNTGYSGKYRQVDWMEYIRMLKSNPETAQIPVILTMWGQVMVGDRDRYLEESGADDAIRMEPASWEPLVEKIKYNLPTDDPTLNTRINLRKRFSGSRTIKVQKEKESVLDFLAFKIFQLIILTASLFVPLIDAISGRDKSSRK